MMLGARALRRGHWAMILSAFSEMFARLFGHGRAGARQRRIGQDRGRVGGADSGLAQGFAGKIETADSGVLVEVAQDIGQLQGAAEMMRERHAGIARNAENAHRQAADGAGDPVAIKVEHATIAARGSGSPASISMPSMIAQKVILAQIEILDGCLQAAQSRRRRAAIERTHVAAPLLQFVPCVRRAGLDRRQCRRPRGRRHRSHTSRRADSLAGCAWPHRTNCRTLCGRRRRCWLRRRTWGQAHSCVARPIGPGGEPPAETAQDAGQWPRRRRCREDARLAQMHALAQRIALLKDT